MDFRKILDLIRYNSLIFLKKSVFGLNLQVNKQTNSKRPFNLDPAIECALKQGVQAG